MATLTQTDRALKDLVKRLDDQLTPAVQTVASKAAEAQLKDRVFTLALANDNRKIRSKFVSKAKKKVKGDGAYSKQWAKKRRSGGRQTSFVDLEFSGDLRKTIKIGTFGKDTVLGYSNAKTMEYAKGNEKRYRGSEDTIFALNTEESNEVLKDAAKHFDKFIDRWLQTF